MEPGQANNLLGTGIPEGGEGIGQFIFISTITVLLASQALGCYILLVIYPKLHVGLSFVSTA